MKAVSVLNISYEILLIDSYSTDKTVELAKQFPVTIYQIPKDVFKSSPAGLFVGLMKSKGKYVQIMGADMTLYKTWLPQALSFLKNSSDGVLGVFGYCSQELYKVEIAQKYREMFEATKEEKQEERNRFVGGILFKGKIRTVDNYNPFLYAEEEEELYPRIKAQGLKLIYYDKEMIHHWGADEEDQVNMEHRFQILWHAQGYLLKLAIHNRTLWSYWFPKYKSFFAYSIGLITISLMLLFPIIFQNGYLLLIPIILLSGWIGYKIARKRSISRIFLWYFTTLKGFFQPYKTGKNYPLDKIKKIT